MAEPQTEKVVAELEKKAENFVDKLLTLITTDVIKAKELGRVDYVDVWSAVNDENICYKIEFTRELFKFKSFKVNLEYTITKQINIKELDPEALVNDGKIMWKNKDDNGEIVLRVNMISLLGNIKEFAKELVQEPSA